MPKPTSYTKPTHQFTKYIDVGLIRFGGGSLEREYWVYIIIGVDGVTIEQALKELGKSSSPRVRIQKMRETSSDIALAVAEANGLAVHLSDVDQPLTSPEEKKQKAIASILAVMPGATIEQVEAFISANTPNTE